MAVDQVLSSVAEHEEDVEHLLLPGREEREEK